MFCYSNELLRHCPCVLCECRTNGPQNEYQFAPRQLNTGQCLCCNLLIIIVNVKTYHIEIRIVMTEKNLSCPFVPLLINVLVLISS